MLPLSPLQSNLPRAEAVRLLEGALEAGVTFFDTAELYRTYPLVRDVLRPPAVVATKAYAYTYQGMKESLERALRETRRERIDIFLLHEQESRLILAGHAEALRCLVEARKAGVVGAVGVSTHAPVVVDAAAEMEEIDIVHPLVNYRGLGLLEGTLDEMLAAIARASRAGKGIYAMKILGGGHLAAPAVGADDGAAAMGAAPPALKARGAAGERLGGTAERAFAFVRGIPDIHAVAVGVKSLEELHYDLALLEGVPSAEELADLAAKVRARPRGLFIEEHCEGCGKCVDACRYGALSLVEIEAGSRPVGKTAGGEPSPGAIKPRAVVNPAKCVLCGYCAAACRDFYIKVV